jgi:hypothetical protein
MPPPKLNLERIIKLKKNRFHFTKDLMHIHLYLRNQKKHNQDHQWNVFSFIYTQLLSQ